MKGPQGYRLVPVDIRLLLLSLLLLIELILVAPGIVFLLGIALYCSEYLHSGLLSLVKYTQRSVLHFMVEETKGPREVKASCLGW